MVRVSRAPGEGSWKIGRERIGRYFFGLNAEMEAIRVFKDDPPIHRLPSSPSFPVSPFGTFISPSRLTNSSRVHQSSNRLPFRISSPNISKSLIFASLFLECLEILASRICKQIEKVTLFLPIELIIDVSQLLRKVSFSFAID